MNSSLILYFDFGVLNLSIISVIVICRGSNSDATLIAKLKTVEGKCFIETIFILINISSSPFNRIIITRQGLL